MGPCPVTDTPGDPGEAALPLASGGEQAGRAQGPAAGHHGGRLDMPPVAPQGCFPPPSSRALRLLLQPLHSTQASSQNGPKIEGMNSAFLFEVRLHKD